MLSMYYGAHLYLRVTRSRYVLKSGAHKSYRFRRMLVHLIVGLTLFRKLGGLGLYVLWRAHVLGSKAVYLGIFSGAYT